MTPLDPVEQTPRPAGTPAPRHSAAWRWLDANVFELGRELRLSYLPPLMVYMAAGISGLTSIVGTFFVKDYLGLSAAFVAGLGFWAGIPWALKMPVGHVIDLLWQWKSWFIYLGAVLISASLLVMVGLLSDRDAMVAVMPVEAWYVLSVLLAPIGYVLQDAVADAMTVEAVPVADEEGRPIDEDRRKLMHTTMQTLGRVAIIGGGVLVALLNLFVFTTAGELPAEQMTAVYRNVYLMALTIPAISVLGVVVAAWIKRRGRARLLAAGMTSREAADLLDRHDEHVEPNWWILGGGFLFVVFTVSMGLGNSTYSQEIIFAGSFAIVAFLVARLTRELEPAARETLIGTAIVIFVFRAVPGTGPGVSWWLIDELSFDPQFFSILSLIGSALTLMGMFLFRRFMAERSISYVVVFLTVASTLLTIPYVGMYYGLHEWTARVTGGLVGPRFIALIDTALESPLGQIAMIPMLAWIARSAPPNLKATYFAVMASFTNLALSLSQLGSKYVNQVFVVTRAVKDPATQAVTTAADYSQLGNLLITVALVGLVLPIAAIAVVKALRLRTA